MPKNSTGPGPNRPDAASSRWLAARDLLQATFAASGELTALLTREGRIDLIAGPWDQIASLPPTSRAVDSGANYLERCRAEAEAGNKKAAKAFEGIRDVLKGVRTGFQRDFEAGDSEGGRRWYRMHSFPIEAIDGAFLRFLDITEEKLAEATLLQRLSFEQGLADIAARLNKLRPEQLDGQMEQLLKEVVEFLGYDRSTLAEDTDEGLVTTHSYARPGFTPLPRGLRHDSFPWYEKQMRANKVIVLSRIPDDIPPEAVKDREGALRLGLKSNALTPLSVEGKVLGALAFGSMTRQIDWQPAQIRRLGLLGEVFAAALFRKRKHLELLAAFEQIKGLKARLEVENLYLRREVVLQHSHGEILGKSRAIRSALEQVEQVAGTDATVLLQGETGTGKELFARAVHNLSRRTGSPLVRVNCAALPSELVESELFGREKGAYTGALTQAIGRFELADGGTIFLDEVGELPLELQAKLLRVVESGEFERLGSPKTIRVDVRIIAATNRDLGKAVEEGKFREDLFYRLSVFPIALPPLRERREDIPLLVRAFVEQFNESMGKSIQSVSRADLKRLEDYAWPGNVRELRNLVERAMIVARGDKLQIPFPTVPGSAPATLALKDVERKHLLKVLELTQWRVRGKQGAAELLEMKPSTLEYRMKNLGIQRPR